MSWRDTPCDVWKGRKDPAGYGVMSRGGRDVGAHRVEWERHHGPIPQGKHVLHHCDNPPCRNIDHLWLGTQGQNVADCIAKGRTRFGRKGEDHYAAKLTAEDVREIRRAARPYLVTRPMLMKKFGVSKATIDGILSRRYWRSL